jgi:hypothetical protein
MDSVRPRLSASGVRLTDGGVGAEYGPTFVETVETALHQLEARQVSDASS